MDKSVGLKDALRTFYPLLILIAAVELLIWAHWNSLLETASYWDSPKYSYSYLVPLFAGVLLFLRRDETIPLFKSLATLGGIVLGVGLLLCVMPFMLPDSIQTMGFLRPELFEAVGVAFSAAGTFLVVQQRVPFSDVSAAERWIGFGIVAVGEAMRLWATHTSHYSPERFSFIVALAGVFVMVGGLRSFRWAGRSIAFLTFMLPLPAVLDSNLAANLQTWATEASTYTLQTLGVGAVRAGNVISVGHDGIPMEVEKACSGLHMLTVLVALSFAVVLVAEIPTWQRIVIVLSAVPVALAVNIIRITATGILFTVLPASQENLREFFHRGAGLAMPPLALILLFLEYKILTNLFIEDEEGLVPQLGLAAAANGGGASAGAVAVTAAIPKRPGQPAAAPMAPLPAKPLPAKPLPAKPLPARPLAARPTPAAASTQRPLPAKPLPVRPVPAKPTSPAHASPTAPAAARPLPARPLPAKQLPVDSGSPLAARPLPARPLPSHLASAKQPAVDPTEGAGPTDDSVATKPPPPMPSGERSAARR